MKSASSPGLDLLRTQMQETGSIATGAGTVDPVGEVYDDRGARYRCRIERKLNWRGKTVYRWVLERKWVSWRDEARGWWTRSEAKANAHGRIMLISRAHDRFEEVGRV